MTEAACFRLLSSVSLEFVLEADKVVPLLNDEFVELVDFIFKLLDPVTELLVLLFQPPFSVGDDLGYCYQQKDEENPTQNAGKS